MQQLLRRTRSTDGLYARAGEVEDSRVAYAIFCSACPQEEREFTYAAAESFVPSFKESESQYKAESGETAEIKREEGERRSDGRCTTIKRERSRQIKKEAVEEDLLYAVPESRNSGSQSGRNVKRKRQESRTSRKKRCTTVKHERSRVVKKEIVEKVTSDDLVEEGAGGLARNIKGRRQTIGKNLPTRTQPARQCRRKKEAVEKTIDEAVAKHSNGSSRCKRKTKIKPQPVEEESALCDIAIPQYGEDDEEQNPGEAEFKHGKEAGTTSDEREMSETLKTRLHTVERVKALGDNTNITDHCETGDTGSSRSSPEDVAPDTDPIRATHVDAVSDDRFDELVQEHNQTPSLENAATLAEDVVVQFSGQGTPYLEPAFTGPCAEIIEEYGSESCDGRDYDDQFTLDRSLSAVLFSHSVPGHQNSEEYMQASNSTLSEIKDDSDGDSGIVATHASPERYVPDGLPQRQLPRLVIDSNRPLPHANPESLVAVGERDTDVVLNITSNDVPDSAIEIELLCGQEVVSEPIQTLPSTSISSSHAEDGGSGNEGSTHRRASSSPRKSPRQLTQQELRKRLIAGKQKSEAKHPGIVEETARRRRQKQLSLRIRSELCAQQREDLNPVVRFNVGGEHPIRTTSPEPGLREMEMEEQMIFACERQIRRTGYLDLAGHRFTSSKEAFGFFRKKWKERRKKRKEQRTNEKRKHLRETCP